MNLIIDQNGMAAHVPTHMLNDAGYVSSPLQRVGLVPNVPWYYKPHVNPSNIAPVPLTYSLLPVYTMIHTVA